MSPAELVHRARAAGLDRIAVTDHNEITGALEARDLDPALVIVGEEVRCNDGSELIGLFLEHRIRPGMSPEKTAERIHHQGGLVYLPHPYAYLTRATARAHRLLPLADIVELFNGRAFWPRWNERARALVHEKRLHGAASSDAHLPSDCGRAWTEVDSASSAANLLAAMSNATLVQGRTVSPLAHVATLSLGLTRLGRALLRRGVPTPAGDADQAIT